MPSKATEKGSLPHRPGKTAGIILAAGESKRMGRPKQLLPVGGLPLICRILGEALSSNLDFVVVVLGCRAEEIKKVLIQEYPQEKYRIIYNPKYPEGMASSIRAGIKEVKGTYDHAMIILADMVHIDAALINHLLKDYLSSGRPIGAITVEGRRSHPVIFSKTVYPELLSIRGDKGGRDLFQPYEGKICLVSAPAKYREVDLDTPEDYEHLVSERYSVTLPSPAPKR